MAKEIERKFLVDAASLGPLTGGTQLSQGYISTSDHTVVRVRIASDQAWLTLKGKNYGAVRSEFEYEIPLQDAREMLDEFCPGKVISKTRYLKQFAEHSWEIDVFAGDNAGLIVAEVELSDPSETLLLPSWVTVEVTDDSRYFNNQLYRHPFCKWVE